MPAWAIKIGLQIAQDPDKAIKFLFMGLMLVVVLFMMLTLPFYFLFLPATEPAKYNDYKQAVINIEKDTRVIDSDVGINLPGQQLNWREMIALDAAIRLKQDFSNTNASDIASYHKSAFIWEEERSMDYTCGHYTDEDGNEHSETCTKIVKFFHAFSLDEVMSNLGLNNDEKESVRNYLVINLDDMDDLGPQDPTNIPAGNYTPVVSKFTWPCDVYLLTSGFGGRVDPVTGIPGEIHGGIDIGAPKGTQVRATMSGVVIFSQFTESGGNIVAIDHQNGYVTRYLHLSQLLVKVGDRVNQNDAIALSGNTGSKTTGAHLHYEIHENGVKKDPLLFYK